jgi:hypothetical protein
MTKGTYGGGTFGFPALGGLGLGLYIDSHGRIYPQLYGGTPRASLSAGYTDDLEGLLTGTSISGSPGGGAFRFNAGMSGTAGGYGIGTPGIGVTHGFGPLEMSRDFSRPWATPSIRDSAATSGVPSRYNVWEYDYPESKAPPALGSTSGPQAASNIGERVGMKNARGASVFTSGAPAIPSLRHGSQKAPGGLPGLIASVTGSDPSDPAQFLPPAGGLLGLIQDYMRANPAAGGSR